MATENPASPDSGVAIAERIPLKGWRRVMAERMTQSHSEHAQVTQMREVDAEDLVRLRREVTADPARVGGAKVTMTHLLLLALARALSRHPFLNSCLVGDEIQIYGEVNIALAVALPDGGLMAPVIKGVDRKSLAHVAQEAAELARKARLRKLRMEDLSGGTFTLTNAGMYGTDFVTPLISAGQNAALGVGKIALKPVVHEGEIVVRSRLGLSVAYDHRTITGAMAALFFQNLQTIVEQPAELLDVAERK